MNRNYIYWIHILFSAPLFIYLGHNPVIKNNLVSQIILSVGIIVMLYHIYRLYEMYNLLKIVNWVNVIHLVLVGPLLILAGWNKSLSYPWAQLCLILGYGAIGNFCVKIYK